ncbi:MAG TPA: CAP domain-containing protein [Symbiobacteriaceae bacterium]|nr:CAP domain-containing protein [Symbiobacteriaceae bacterium]
MKWTNKLAAFVVTMLLMTPNVASAYYWYGLPTYASSTPTARTASTLSSTSTASTTSTTSAVEQTLLRLTNQERTKYGLTPLQADSTLTSLARMKSSDMQAKNYFSHTSPTYGTPAQMLARNGVTYNYYAENLAKGADATRIHAMWMNSAGHRANILDARLTHIGIGVAPGSGGYAATQLFIAR